MPYSLLRGLLAAIVLLLPGLLAAPLLAQQSDRVSVLVLDASGSMWGQLEDGRSKIETARDVIGDFLASRDPNQPLGIVAYGHNRKGDCGDIEVIAPVGVYDRDGMLSRMLAISPKGKTPLADSMRLAASQVPPSAEQADIVLVTDGLETCGADPCAVATKLARDGIALRAHVVGFGLTEQEAETLSCIPEQTGGILLRPQSGAELSEALARIAANGTSATQTGVRLIFSYPGAMPETYSWSVRNDETGDVRHLGTVQGEARYQPFAVDLPPGPHTALLTAEAGQGETQFAVAGEALDVVVVMQGTLPVTTLRDHGPYAAIGETVLFDLNITQSGQETGGAALALRLYPASDGESITYSTVDGGVGRKTAGINLPNSPGPYILRLETWGGDVVEEMTIRTESDPVVTLGAPPVVAPGAAIPVESAGSQLASDRIEIWQGESLVDWGVTLSDLQYGNMLRAPATLGVYELVYKGSNSRGEQVEKARTVVEVGTVHDDARGTQAVYSPQADAGHGPDNGEDGRPWRSYPYRCLVGDKPNDICEFRDNQTGLAFMLPEGWVADQPSDTPLSAGAVSAGLKGPVTIEFWQVGGNQNQIVLNPRQWIADSGTCVVSRAGPLCLWRNELVPDDEGAYAALSYLQTWLTTGEVIRRCGKADCLFDHPRSSLIGRLPGLWAVEMPIERADGLVATWFFDRDRAGNFKLIGLNQDGGEDCREVEVGQLCTFTPYISSDEYDLIAETVLPRNGLTRGSVVDATTFQRLETMLEGQ